MYKQGIENYIVYTSSKAYFDIMKRIYDNSHYMFCCARPESIS